MTANVFIDTNILIYAHNQQDAEKYRVANARLLEFWAGNGAILSVQVLQEFYVNAIRVFPRPLTAMQARQIVADYAPWAVPVTPERVLEAVDLSSRHHFSFWDSLILAWAIAAGAEVLLTEDLTHGRVIEGVRIENPFLTAAAG
ncbi:MAG TPA: PIN domain-containing protein [bacterium]|nr:PIN domain-containing protein [bacterium]